MPYCSLTADVAALLNVSSQAQNIRLEPCAAGGNNRVFVATVGSRRVVVKQYFRHPGDARDRLQAEQAFLSYAAAAGVDSVPHVIACDSARGIGIYEFIEGRKLSADDIDSRRVREAGDFFRALNQPSKHASRWGLPTASEACFSIGRHFELVDGRIRRLTSIPATDEVGRAAMEFAQDLSVRWKEVKSAIRKAVPEAALSADVTERCISPSDFGFHNAIARPSGSVCFLDFEYAGWDDPAKMVGDFFSHPALPVSWEHFEDFLGRTMSFSRRAEELAARARLLVPVFQMKWCCIILNEFIPLSAQRRRFANPGINEDTRKRRQLEKARALFEKI